MERFLLHSSHFECVLQLYKQIDKNRVRIDKPANRSNCMSPTIIFHRSHIVAVLGIGLGLGLHEGRGTVELLTMIPNGRR
jgi:hypothetical protein